MPASFPAKLLLFGEYTVLNGSRALSVPLKKWEGRWEQQSETPHMSLIPEYYRWLNKVDLAPEDIFQRMVADYEDGWSYMADIPIGYGVGSSGAYVAAVYDRYLHDGKMDCLEACTTLARMESYFHGSSSGMDPLVSYSGKAVYKNENGDFELLDDHGWPEGYQVCLLDSGITRETASLVNRYMERNEDKKITRQIKNQLMPLVDHAIDSYIDKKKDKLEQSIEAIGQFQREHFEDMIPDSVREKWDRLSELPGVYVKLCGAGGGGYFLVIDTNSTTSDEAKAAKLKEFTSPV